jgi:hypothetical protein
MPTEEGLDDRGVASPGKVKRSNTKKVPVPLLPLLPPLLLLLLLLLSFEHCAASETLNPKP